MQNTRRRLPAWHLSQFPLWFQMNFFSCFLSKSRALDDRFLNCLSIVHLEWWNIRRYSRDLQFQAGSYWSKSVCGSSHGKYQWWTCWNRLEMWWCSEGLLHVYHRPYCCKGTRNILSHIFCAPQLVTGGSCWCKSWPLITRLPTLVPLTTDITGLAGKCISPQMLLSLSTLSALYLKVKST